MVFEPHSPKFTFADLFVGIGGTRLALQESGGECVFTCEIDKFARQTYEVNFSNKHEIATDIRSVDPSAVPDHDVLVAGFPCQPFSLAGVSKKNALGRPHGFECNTQGTLFFDIERILKIKRPKAVLLENVKNLLSHDQGKTFAVIRMVLEQLGYNVRHRVIDASVFVPQHRERVYIIALREGEFDWDNVSIPSTRPQLTQILHPEDGSETPEPPYTHGPLAKVSERYVLTENLWVYLQAYAARRRAAGNGFGYGLVDTNGQSRTLSARYHKDGSEILTPRGLGVLPRRLTPRECARLMGFPEKFDIPVSDTQAYRQFGNSVVVPAVFAIARELAANLARTYPNFEYKNLRLATLEADPISA